MDVPKTEVLTKRFGPAMANDASSNSPHGSGAPIDRPPAARVGHEPAARMAPQSRCATGGTGAFKTTAELVQLPVRSSTTTPPGTSIVSDSGWTPVPVSPTSSGGTRAVTGHDIAIETVDEPTSNERVRQGIERMPKSTAMPKNQVSSRELSELSRIQAN